MVILIRTIYVLFAVAVLGCNDQSTQETQSSNQPRASASFSIYWQRIPVDQAGKNNSIERAQLDDCSANGIARVQCDVYDDDDNKLTSNNWPCSDRGGIIDDIPPGTNRQFVVFGIDADGEIAYRGQTDRGIDLIPGQEADIGTIRVLPFKLSSQKPLDQQIIQPDEITLKWNSVDGAIKYRVTVAKNKHLDDPIIDEDIEETILPIFSDADLSEGTYYWGVYPIDKYGNTGNETQILSFSIELAPSANDFSYKLPDTGQMLALDGVIGEDSEYNINPPAYTMLDIFGDVLEPDNGFIFAAVRDDQTGLIWEVKTDKDGPRNKDKTYIWQDTTGYLEELNAVAYGGCSTWRLPTVTELTSLMNYNRYDLAIDTTYFPNTVLGAYWSSTESKRSESEAWAVYTKYGGIFPGPKSKLNSVRAVCGEQHTQQLRDNGDGTVTDETTGLMWQQGVYLEPMNWEAALEYCENLQLAGYDDWRMPNIKELQSIIDFTRLTPVIDISIFDMGGIVSGGVWSSTTCVDPPTYTRAWRLELKSGIFILGNSAGSSKLNKIYVLAVRGGG